MDSKSDTQIDAPPQPPSAKPFRTKHDTLPWRLTRSRLIRHFQAFALLPLAGLVAAIVLSAAGQFRWWHPLLLLAMYFLVGGLGVSVGFHRQFAHRSFATTRSLRVLLAALGSMAAQGPVAYWVAIHRHHHRFSDRPGDPHSPVSSDNHWLSRWGVFFHGHVGWFLRLDIPNPRCYAADVLRDPLLAYVNRTYLGWVAVGMALPACAAFAITRDPFDLAAGAIWGGLARICIVNNVTWAVNSVGHTAGKRVFSTSDNSRNHGLLAILAWGEGWHNNHHQCPSSAKFGLRPTQIDVGWWMIRLLIALGLAWDVKLSDAQAAVRARSVVLAEKLRAGRSVEARNQIVVDRLVLHVRRPG